MLGTLEDRLGRSTVGEVSLELELDEASKVSQSEFMFSNMAYSSVRRTNVDIAWNASNNQINKGQ